MPEYQFADKGGKIVSVEYDKNNYFSAEQVLASLDSAFNRFPFPAYIEQVIDYDDVFHVTFPEGNDGIGDVFICAKGTTPGGRSGLKDEQRIQPKAKYLNYVYDRGEEGKKAIFLGVYNRDGETILCTWKVMASAAASIETPISKQIKITSIAKAMREGFVQQDKGKGEYACAFRPEFLYFYLRNCDWLHTGHVSELAEHTMPENFGATEDTVADKGFEEVNFYTGIKCKYPRNRIVFGAPGTGKSFRLKDDCRALLANTTGGYERVTFHPDNMFIWASMNSADQGVFPMDTAFKRRWSFEYLGINENESKIRGSIMLGEDDIQVVEWNILRKAINEKLASEYRVNEDKLMGPFFLPKTIITTVSDTDDTIADTDLFLDTFKSKVIMYLYEDAAKQHKHKLFAGCPDTTKYSAVCEAFDKIGMRIFGEDFEERYYNPQKG